MGPIVGTERTWAWVVRAEAGSLIPLRIDRAELTKAVQQLRASVGGSGRGRGVSLLDAPEFDTGTARRLYQELIAPLVPRFEGVSHLMVVADGPLHGLPFPALVTDDVAPPATTAALRSVPWLARRFAVTTLPSIGTLTKLRRAAAASRAKEPFVGFGAPSLDGKQGSWKGPDALRGAIDAQAIRALPRLPETADELRAMARALRASPGSIHLGRAATKTAVRSMRLDRYRVVAFSTHGLMAGDFEGRLAEPALVLTPPARPTPGDDGLLGASDIALLQFDADWVVLSACNTAAPDGRPGAEGLSGLAKAFFFAGTRALLVSHWSVSSSGTQHLMTRLFSSRVAESRGRAEALRQAMLGMIDDRKHPWYAHPYYWAPFAIAGEGGRALPR